jgi:hypothetical protein
MCGRVQTNKWVTPKLSHPSSCGYDSPKIMFAPDSLTEPDDVALERIYRRTPAGALTIAGIAMALVFALWFAFYLLVFLPRGFLH